MCIEISSNEMENKITQTRKLQALFLLCWRPRSIILFSKLEGKDLFFFSLTSGSALLNWEQGSPRQNVKFSEAQKRAFQTGTRGRWKTKDAWRGLWFPRISQPPRQPSCQSRSHVRTVCTNLHPDAMQFTILHTCLNCA